MNVDCKGGAVDCKGGAVLGENVGMGEAVVDKRGIDKRGVE